MFIPPMLADKMPTGPMPSGYVAEEKFDGIRIGIETFDNGSHTAWSRLNNTLTLPPHIVEQVNLLPARSYLDGELIVPGGNSWDVKGKPEQNMLVLFDIIEVVGERTTALPYSTRRQYLEAAVEQAQDEVALFIPNVIQFPTLDTAEQVWANGGEGLILKRLNSPYRIGGRTPEWLKVKQVLEATLRCVGFEEGTRKGVLSVAVLQDEAGQKTTTKVPTEDLVQAITRNPSAFIGRGAEITFQMRTPSGNYRHPMLKRFVGDL